MSNPRRTNGARRNALRKRVAAQGRPCAICGQPIDYSLTTWIDPKDGKEKRHPWSYELDEIVPVSKGGSPFDINNVQPAHRLCNQKKGDKVLRRVVEAPESEEEELPTSRDW